jgi:hypothetical protein
MNPSNTRVILNYMLTCDVSVGQRIVHFFFFFFFFFCRYGTEDRDHLFFLCGFSSRVWMEVNYGVVQYEPSHLLAGLILCLLVCRIGRANIL